MRCDTTTTKSENVFTGPKDNLYQNQTKGVGIVVKPSFIVIDRNFTLLTLKPLASSKFISGGRCR